mgnify:CR=1 FL=1
MRRQLLLLESSEKEATMNSSISLVWELAGLTTLGIKIYALADIFRRPAEDFPFLNKLTKPTWLAIAGLSIAGHVIFGAFGMLGLVGLVASSVYLVDVKPKIDEIQNNRR